ncbi:hypothetical protein K8R03_00010 [Candidatus Kaiserbacteria bacterium]|nr:hypothetical protein [Candidatus Kaiserbacteria bacterium]
MTTQAQTKAVSIPGWLIWLAVAAVLVIGGFSTYAYVNNLRTTAVQYENRLSTQYLDNQNELSSYISGFYEKLGVANLKSEKLNKILTDAVKGRYDKEGFGKGGGMFNAIAEAYPDLATLNIYDKIVDHVSSGREAYRGVQKKLLDILRSFDTWRQDGAVRSVVVSSLLGIPSQRLVARVGDKSTRGQEALDQMYRIVLADDAINAYQTGKMAPLQAK